MQVFKEKNYIKKLFLTMTEKFVTLPVKSFGVGIKGLSKFFQIWEDSEVLRHMYQQLRILLMNGNADLMLKCSLDLVPEYTNGVVNHYSLVNFLVILNKLFFIFIWITLGTILQD